MNCIAQKDFCNELFTNVEPYSQYGNSTYDFSNDKSLANVKEGTRLILSPEKHLTIQFLLRLRVAMN